MSLCYGTVSLWLIKVQTGLLQALGDCGKLLFTIVGYLMNRTLYIYYLNQACELLYVNNKYN